MAKGRSFHISIFHGVSVHPAGDCACHAVEVISGARFLSSEAPKLPLEDCNLVGACRCTYKHYKDRRSEPRRDSDIGLPGKMLFQQIEEKRLGIGRRITDAA